MSSSRKTPVFRAVPRLPGVTELEWHGEVVTPMLGGGVEAESPGKPCDPITPIRVPSVRGQLRFWWRACNPRRATTLAELWAQEAELWGSMERPSKVSIQVSQQPVRRPFEVFRLDGGKVRTVDGRDDIAYGAFPLRPEGQAGAGARGRPGELHRLEGEFILSIRAPNALLADVEWALWAWSSFGGLGARTRRGFGAVCAANRRESIEDLRKKLAQVGPRIAGVPSLHGACISRDAKRSAPVGRQGSSQAYDRRRGGSAQNRAPEPPALAAWKHGLGLLRKLRQGEGLGRNEGKNGRPGRSRWPEPDAIRKLAKKTAPAHAERVVHVDAFPRAAFGMPIIFHFKDIEKGEPADTELLPEGATRMASPLIIRPYFDGREWMTLALALLEPLPRCVLKVEGREIPVKTELSGAEAQAISVLKLPKKIIPDPIERFLQELEKKT